jgi:hypothetical protein
MLREIFAELQSTLLRAFVLMAESEPALRMRIAAIMFGCLIGHDRKEG